MCEFVFYVCLYKCLALWFTEAAKSQSDNAAKSSRSTTTFSTCSMRECLALMVTCISWPAEVTEGAQQCACGWTGIFILSAHPHTAQETQFTGVCTFL